MNQGDAEGDEIQVQPARSGWRTGAVALLLYAGCLAAATFPAITHLGSRLPTTLADPLMHLWVMRWYKSCLLEGRLPFFSPEIQYPAGAPLGNFSPMHLQALIYFPLSTIVPDDVACYNLLWFAGFLFTAMATFHLARGVTGESAAAWLAGLLAMLCGPMTVHAVAHLELVYAGGFSLFLASWIAFVDRPGRLRLASAVAGLIVMTMGAAYFLVLAIPPAVLYVVWRMAQQGKSLALRWLAERAPWLVAFGALAFVPLAGLFANQLWAVANVGSMRREWSQFDYYKAPAWSYAAPTPLHALGRLLPCDPYAKLGFGGGRMGEGASYLGVVALGLLVYAGVKKVGFPRASFWWAALALLVILSMGASLDIGTWRLPLPARWLWKYVPIYRLTRNPGRFNLLACQVAAVIAAAGLSNLLGKLKQPRLRLGVVAVLALVATLDLRNSAYSGAVVPPLPGYYRSLLAEGKTVNVLDAPMAPSGAVDTLGSVAAYWQSIHRGRTSAGYSGHDNDRFNELVFHGSPVSALWLGWDGYLADPNDVSFGVVRGVGFRDYAWLFTRFHQFDRIVLHEWPGASQDFPVHLGRLKALLQHTLVSAGDGISVYDPARLAAPERPVLLATDGWLYGILWRQWPLCPMSQTSRLVAYNPTPGRPLVFRLEACAFQRARDVRLVANGEELARWTIGPEALAVYSSPPVALPAGLSELELICDGQDVGVGRLAIAEGDSRAYSLRVAAVRLETAAGDDVAVASVPQKPSRSDPAPAGARR